MSVCDFCKGTTFEADKKLSEYRTDRFGVPLVLVNSVLANVCSKCGEIESVKIPDPQGLMVAAALSRIFDPLKLDGSEVRFLRKTLRTSSKNLAEFLEVKAETVSRWENDKMPISASSEKLLRLIVASFLSEEYAVDVDKKELAGMRFHGFRRPDAKDGVEMYFERVRVVSKNRKATETYVPAQAVAVG